jgi:large subunit ribosomal protein L22e
LQSKTATKVKAKAKTCTVNITKPAEDGVIDITDMIAYLQKMIKVKNKAGNLGTSVVVEQDKKTANLIVVKSFEPVELAKRYIKYLTKKYLQKNQLKKFIRTVAVSKEGYELRYHKIGGGEGEGEEEEGDDEE